MRACFITAALAFVAAIHAQDFAPELAPAATKYKANIAALDAQKTAALARVQQTYSAALDGAERTATAAGNLNVVAAISKEREAVKSGLMAPALPPELPKTLAQARKAYMDGAARAAAEIVPKQKAANADYLRTAFPQEAARLAEYSTEDWSKFTWSVLKHGFARTKCFIPWPDTQRRWRAHLPESSAGFLDRFLPPRDFAAV